jgi:alpha 1,3-glucosidase
MVLHRDIHNAYGIFEHRASIEGLKIRDGFNRRPFVLSRSFFFGSQRLGPNWTGDTQAQYVEAPGSLNEMLA